MVTALIVILVGISFYQQPLSQQMMNNNPIGSLMYDELHYDEMDIRVKVANFNVLTYELDIAVDNQLEVVATLTVDETCLNTALRFIIVMLLRV